MFTTFSPIQNVTSLDMTRCTSAEPEILKRNTLCSITVRNIILLTEHAYHRDVKDRHIVLKQDSIHK